LNRASFRSARRPGLRAVPAVLLGLLIVTLTVPSTSLGSWEDKSGSFEAYWTQGGTVQIIDFIDDGIAAAGRLTGNVVLQTNTGRVPGFETDCVIFADYRTGGIGRCIWTGATGDRIFVELKSGGQYGFGSAQGTFIGGDGRFETIRGGFTFEWNYSVSGRGDATLDGHTFRMNGRYEIP